MTITFASFGLNENILKAVTDAGFSQPTPIQAGTIQHTLDKKDVMACAPTGSGKTAAFVLPALHRIVSGPSKVTKGHGPRILILTPTRELSTQISDAIKLFSKHVRVSNGVVIGGVSYNPQYALLARPLDILIATPGRLIDHIQDRRIDLSRVELLILDEADRMLDMGFLKPVERIIDALPQGQFHPQTLLFSATFSADIEKVAHRMLRNPQRVELAEARKSHADISQHVYQSDNNEHKMDQLKHLLENGKIWQAIVFAATKHGADKLARKISGWGHKTAALHGNLKQNQRKRVIQSMHDGSLKVLVATDVAARGIDVKKLSHVINFDLPNVSEDYVHRIGRTGRAGETGIAIALVTPPDMPLLRDIEKMLKRTFKLESFTEVPSIMSEAEFRALRVPKTIRGGHKGQGGGTRPTHSSHGAGSTSKRTYGGKPANPQPGERPERPQHGSQNRHFSGKPQAHSPRNPNSPRAERGERPEQGERKPFKAFTKYNRSGNNPDGAYAKREGNDNHKPYAKRFEGKRDGQRNGQSGERKFHGERKFGDKKSSGFGGGYKGKSQGGYKGNRDRKPGGNRGFGSSPRPTRVNRDE
jgi:superfamily II DNA/RNA helicase